MHAGQTTKQQSEDEVLKTAKKFNPGRHGCAQEENKLGIEWMGGHPASTADL